MHSDETGVLVLGEAIVDEVHHADGSVTRVPGGSPANVAFGLARLDVSATLLTCLADDSDGRAVTAHLAAAGVHVDPRSVTTTTTPLARVVLAADGQPQYSFEIDWQLPEVGDLPATARALHIGSYAAFLAPGADAVRSAARRAHDHGVPVMFDPNIRPQLMGDPDAARRRFQELARLSTVIKFSDEDLEWLFPALDEAAVIATLLNSGVACVVVTHGRAGARLSNRQSNVFVPAVNVAHPVDTIGAGDSFMSALIRRALTVDLGSATSAVLTEIGTYCARAAAITVGRAGAKPPTVAELDGA